MTSAEREETISNDDQKARADEAFLSEHSAHSRGLDRDAFNAWATAFDFDKTRRLKSIPTYEAYLVSKFGAKQAAQILSDSDASAVSAFNNLAAEFNEQCMGAGLGCDPERLSRFRARVTELFQLRDRP